MSGDDLDVLVTVPSSWLKKSRLQALILSHAIANTERSTAMSQALEDLKAKVGELDENVLKELADDALQNQLATERDARIAAQDERIAELEALLSDLRAAAARDEADLQPLVDKVSSALEKLKSNDAPAIAGDGSDQA